MIRSAAAAAVGLLAVPAVPAVVAARAGSGALGVFGVGWLVAVALGLAATAVVWWTVRDPRHGDDVRRAACERALTLVVPLAVVVLVGAPWILSVAGPQARDTGVGATVLLALASVPYAVVTVVTRSAAVRGRVRHALVVPGCALAVAVVVAWVATPVIGVLGAAAGWLLGQSAVAAVAVLRTRSMITRPVS